MGDDVSSEPTIVRAAQVSNHQNMAFSNGESFLEQVCEMLKETGIMGPEKESEEVVRFTFPDELESILNLSLKEAADKTNEDELKTICKNVIKYSVKTGNRHFHNQLFGGVDNYGLAGSWITDALNTSQYTFEVGPVFSLMEHSVLKKAAALFGFPEDSDGIFSPGGSISNMYGIVLARYKAFPNVKTQGMGAIPRLAAFTSDDSHYSMLKGAHWLGIGTDNMIKVRTDSRGRMIPEELKKELMKAKDNGLTPFMVNATAGSTVLGAFDPFEEIADICQDHGLWMHVDACLGGTLRLSEKYGGVLRGVERADSIAWNPHKSLGAPLQCSLFLVRHKKILMDCNSATAHYLFQKDKFYDVSYDTGDKSVQCGRKVDSFKLWLMWKARGDKQLRTFVDNAFECALYFKERISNRPGFKLVLDEIQCANICFWYIPKSMRNIEHNAEWFEKLHKIAPKIKEKMILKGSLMIGYTPLDHKGLKNFFRMVVTCHPPPTKEDMDYAIEEIEKCGEEIDTH